MTRGFEIVAAAGTVFLVTVLAGLPWGLSPEWRFFLPQLPFIFIYLWTARDASSLPPVLILTAGLLVDVSSGGPLGFWSLIYLAGYSLTANSWPGPIAKQRRLLLFAITMSLLMLFEWAASSLYYFTLAAPDPFLRALAGSILIFPILRIAFTWFFDPQPEISNPSLARGR